MSWILATILLLVTLAVAFQLSVLRKAKKMEGEPAPALASDQAERGEGSRLLYFYSPKCAPCRRMAPLIEELIAAYPGRVNRIDIAEQRETVNDYKIRATPTTVLVRDGKIEKVMLGYQPAARLRGLLDG